MMKPASKNVGKLKKQKLDKAVSLEALWTPAVEEHGLKWSDFGEKFKEKSGVEFSITGFVKLKSGGFFLKKYHGWYEDKITGEITEAISEHFPLQLAEGKRLFEELRETEFLENLKLMLIARYKNPISGFYNGNMPLEIFKLIYKLVSKREREKKIIDNNKI